MASESSLECDPQSMGYPKLKCTPGASGCPGRDKCGKSNKKCYCTTTLFPKPDPIRKARRTFEKELLPVHNNLSDLQNRVRSMYINEMNNCICGAFIPDNPFPDPITCTCAKFLGPKPSGDRICSCNGKSIPSFSSKSSKTTYSSLVEESQGTPFVCVGEVPFARSGKSRRSKSRKSAKRSRSRSKSETKSGHKGRKRHKSKRKSSRKSHKSSSTKKSSKQVKEEKMESKLQPPPLTESQQEFMCRRLLALARNMFYKGPVSHYLNQNSPVYYHNICDCPSIDALADPRDTNPKKDVCALTTTDFPLRPGQALTTDPDDPALYEVTTGQARKTTIYKHKHKSKKSKSPSVIKLKLRLKRSKSDTKRGRKKHKSRRASRSSHRTGSSRSSRSSKSSRSSGSCKRRHGDKGSKRSARSHSQSSRNSRKRGSLSSGSRNSSYSPKQC